MLLDLIKKRRSVRSYLDKPIPKKDLAKCIEAARLAPSACNAQPWKFIIVDEPKLKNKVTEKAFSGIYSMNKFAGGASALVVVISEKQKFASAIAGQFRGTKYYLLDVGIACEHFILQAEELGIGSCWIGWFNEKAIKKELNIPRQKKIDTVISLGYYRESEPRPKSRKPTEEMSSFNTYR